MVATGVLAGPQPLLRRVRSGRAACTNPWVQPHATIGATCAWRVAPVIRRAQRRGRCGCAAATRDVAAAEQDLEGVAAEFKAWYVARARDLPTDLTPRPAGGPSGGICMVTSKAVQQGAPLLAVPRSLLISADTARASPLCGPLLERSDLDDWQALILHLLCECADPSSAWTPYLALLRAADMSRHPLLWGDEQRAWLEGSPMARLLQSRRAQVEGDTAALVAAGANELPIAGSLPQPLVTPGSVGWAAAVLLSRAFSLYLAPEPDHSILPMEDFGSWDRAGQDVLALVPWADMLQHSSESGDASVLQYDVETDTAFLCAHRDYSPDDEVFDSYGPGLSPCDLLMDYGFVDPANTNARYDALPADIAGPRGPRNRALLAAMDRLQGTGALLALGPSGPDVTGLTLLRASLAGEAELVKAGWRIRSGPNDLALAARVLGRLSQPEAAATEAAVLAALAVFCAKALAAYPSSLSADEEEAARVLAELPGAPRGRRRDLDLRLQVLRALISEKSALTGTSVAVAEWQARLQGGCPPSELYDNGSDDEDE